MDQSTRFNVSPVQRHQFDVWLRMREAVYAGLDREFHRREMEMYVGDDDKTCLIASVDSGHACGMVEVSLRNIVDGCLSSPVGYVEGVCVVEAFRNEGVSRCLLEHAEEWCRGRGCREIATDAELDNESAQRFHRHMGFKETFRIVEYRKTL